MSKIGISLVKMEARLSQEGFPRHLPFRLVEPCERGDAEAGWVRPVFAL